MRSRYVVHDPDRAHFITCTIVDWLPVFTTPACSEILIESFAYCRQHKSLRLHAWVVMDNHVHAIVAAPHLTAVIADWKKYTARALVHQIEREQRTWLLQRLREQKAAYRTRSEYQVWQEGFHPQAILDDSIYLQKLEYIHNNPVRRGWVSSPEHWRYSSAHEQLPGANALLKCDAWN